MAEGNKLHELTGQSDDDLKLRAGIAQDVQLLGEINPRGFRRVAPTSAEPFVRGSAARVLWSD